MPGPRVAILKQAKEAAMLEGESFDFYWNGVYQMQFTVISRTLFGWGGSYLSVEMHSMYSTAPIDRGIKFQLCMKLLFSKLMVPSLRAKHTEKKIFLSPPNLSFFLSFIFLILSIKELSSSHTGMSFVRVQMVHLYSCTDTATAWKKSCFILSDR